jgi:hypothetical protein
LIEICLESGLLHSASPSEFELLLTEVRRGALTLCYPGSDSGSRRELKLLEDLADVILGGALGDRELLGYLAVD